MPGLARWAAKIQSNSTTDAIKEKKPAFLLALDGVAAAYSPGCDPSTIGAAGLNFSVRDGKRWGPCARPPSLSVPCATYGLPQPPCGENIFCPLSRVLCLASQVSSLYMTCLSEYAAVPRTQALGLLVPLGFAIAGFTPAAYRRRRLRRPSVEVPSRRGFRT